MTSPQFLSHFLRSSKKQNQTAEDSRPSVHLLETAQGSSRAAEGMESVCGGIYSQGKWRGWIVVF